MRTTKEDLRLLAAHARDNLEYLVLKAGEGSEADEAADKVNTYIAALKTKIKELKAKITRINKLEKKGIK